MKQLQTILAAIPCTTALAQEPPAITPNTAGGAAHNYAANEKGIVGDLILFMDKICRTLPDREKRAIVGLSMGSGTSTNVALRRLDIFASVGMPSAGKFRGRDGVPLPGGGPP
ncbi:MAG: alpha/beta hydrolase-fold protein [Gammaproteobacteria bacterium]|nr:alpha/beta hydrolase-fold protein [Gammaproteobacteria bacterium]